MHRKILLGFIITVLFSCSSEVKEQVQVQEAVEEVAPDPFVVQISEDSNAQVPSGNSNSIDENGLIKWYLEADANVDEYRIQQHKWNKWVDMGSLDPESLKGDHYEFEVKLLSGRNIFRVRKKGISRKRVTPVEIFVKLQDLKSSIKWQFNADETAIIISEEAMYEIFNEAGKLVDKGIATEIDISNLVKGGYYFNYALFMDSFQKK